VEVFYSFTIAMNMYSKRTNQKGIQTGRESPAFPYIRAMASVECAKNFPPEGAVVLRRPNGAFLIGTDEWTGALCHPLLFAPRMMRSRTWPLSPGDENRVSDEDAWDFAEILEIALAELPEEVVAPHLVWEEFRGGGVQRLRELIAFCRGGGFTVSGGDTVGNS
jgi:hypothetical protein